MLGGERVSTLRSITSLFFASRSFFNSAITAAEAPLASPLSSVAGTSVAAASFFSSAAASDEYVLRPAIRDCDAGIDLCSKNLELRARGVD
jgi:hypothetical protein